MGFRLQGLELKIYGLVFRLYVWSLGSTVAATARSARCDCRSMGFRSRASLAAETTGHNLGLRCRDMFTQGLCLSCYMWSGRI